MKKNKILELPPERLEKIYTNFSKEMCKNIIENNINQDFTNEENLKKIFLLESEVFTKFINTEKITYEELLGLSLRAIKSDLHRCFSSTKTPPKDIKK